MTTRKNIIMMKSLNKTNALHATLRFLLAFVLCACNNNKFQVKGTITEAKDSTSILSMSLEGPVTMDSVVLDESGDFEFSGDKSEAPEFYRLRIAGNIINVSIDSTETVTFTASYPTMSSKYEVEGSDNCKRIKELWLLQQKLLTKVIAISNAYLQASKRQKTASILP